MQLNQIRKTAASTLSIPSTNCEVLFSYSTPVALRDGSTYYRHDNFYSVTTSKHVNAFCGNNTFKVKTKDWKELLNKFAPNL